VKKELLNEIINLKERRNVLEMECGISEKDKHIFSRTEMKEIRKTNDDINACYMLESVNEQIEEDEQLFKSVCMTEEGTDRTKSWNKEWE